jgi:hypothetical protein
VGQLDRLADEHRRLIADAEVTYEARRTPVRGEATRVDVTVRMTSPNNEGS